VAIAPLRVTTARLGVDAYVVSIVGELDIATVDELETELRRVVAEGGQRVIFDLVGLTFIESVSLGLLTRTARLLRARGGDCVVVVDDPRILRVFEVTGLDHVFRIERSLAEAVEELVGNP
jgi:anti-sigma B factor antagonist